MSSYLGVLLFGGGSALALLLMMAWIKSSNSAFLLPARVSVVLRAAGLGLLVAGIYGLVKRQMDLGACVYLGAMLLGISKSGRPSGRNDVHLGAAGTTEE